MSGWLTTAANAFRKRSDAPPQSFEVSCACGRKVSGVRTPVAQRVACSGCRSDLFVLPASVYPAPRGPAPPKVVKRPPPPPATEDDRTIEEPAPRREPRQRGKRPSPIGKAASRPSEAGRPESRPGVVVDARPSPLGRIRRVAFGPVSQVLTGVAVVVVATVWWLGHLKARDEAREVIGRVPRLAEEALREQDAAEAAEQYEQLRAAVVLLGRDDLQSRRWRQLARETAAIRELSVASLHDILAEAIDASSGPGGSVWPDLFRSNYRDGWVVVDATVSRINQRRPAQGQFQIDFPFVVGEHTGRLVAELPIFEGLIAEGEGPRRVIFAAQIADCRLATGARPVWRIDLRPETSFLWATPETYRMFDLPEDDGTLKILREQSLVLGVEE